MCIKSKLPASAWLIINNICIAYLVSIFAYTVIIIRILLVEISEQAFHLLWI